MKDAIKDQEIQTPQSNPPHPPGLEVDMEYAGSRVVSRNSLPGSCGSYGSFEDGVWGFVAKTSDGKIEA